MTGHHSKLGMIGWLDGLKQKLFGEEKGESGSIKKAVWT